VIELKWFKMANFWQRRLSACNRYCLKSIIDIYATDACAIGIGISVVAKAIYLQQCGTVGVVMSDVDFYL
jgi:hypothetical protein